MTPIAIMNISSKQRRSKCLLWSNCDLSMPAPPQSLCIEMECKNYTISIPPVYVGGQFPILQPG